VIALPLPAVFETFPDEAAWLAARRRFGIGASEAYDVLLGDRWRVYNEKTAGEGAPRDEPDDDLAWGHDVEHAAERNYKRRRLAPGEVYTRCDLTIARIPGLPVFATPDALVTDAAGRVLRIVEVKRRRWRDSSEWGDEGTDEVPARVLVQVQLQMHLTGAPEAHVFGSLGDTAPRIYVVRYDEATAVDIAARLLAFWSEHVIPRTPPVFDGRGSADSGLAARFPFNRIAGKLDAVAPGSDVARHVEALRQADEELEHATRAHATARQRVQADIGDRAGLQGPGFRITWKAGANGRTFRAQFTPNGEPIR
jgi:predicted phage-related endonuclease